MSLHGPYGGVWPRGMACFSTPAPPLACALRCGFRPLPLHAMPPASIPLPLQFRCDLRPTITWAVSMWTTLRPSTACGPAVRPPPRTCMALLEATGPVRHVMSDASASCATALARARQSKYCVLLPLAHAAAVGLMIATGALLREKSRSGHFRIDFPRRYRLIDRLTLRLSAGDVVARFVPAHVAVGV